MTIKELIVKTASDHWDSLGELEHDPTHITIVINPEDRKQYRRELWEESEGMIIYPPIYSQDEITNAPHVTLVADPEVKRGEAFVVGVAKLKEDST